MRWFECDRTNAAGGFLCTLVGAIVFLVFSILSLPERNAKRCDGSYNGAARVVGANGFGPRTGMLGWLPLSIIYADNLVGLSEACYDKLLLGTGARLL